MSPPEGPSPIGTPIPELAPRFPAPEARRESGPPFALLPRMESAAILRRLDDPKPYRPRRPERSPFYAVHHQFFDRFTREYEQRFERTFGPLGIHGETRELVRRVRLRRRRTLSRYGKGIEADDLAEELYRRLMVCRIRQGREAESLAVYRRCRKTLSSVLGVDPTAETRAIAESITRSLA